MDNFFCQYTSLYRMFPLSCPWARPVSLDVPALQALCRIELPRSRNPWKKHPMWTLLLLYRPTSYFKPLPLYQGDNWTGIMLIRLTSISASIGFFFFSLPSYYSYIHLTFSSLLYMCAYICTELILYNVDPRHRGAIKFPSFIPRFWMCSIYILYIYICIYITYGHISCCCAVYSRLSATFFGVWSHWRDAT